MAALENCRPQEDLLSRCSWSLPAPGVCGSEDAGSNNPGTWDPVPVRRRLSLGEATTRLSRPSVVAATSVENAAVRLVLGPVPTGDCVETACSMLILAVAPDNGRLVDHLVWIEQSKDCATLMVYALLLVEHAHRPLEVWWRHWTTRLEARPRVRFMELRPRQDGTGSASLIVENEPSRARFAWAEVQLTDSCPCVCGHVLTLSWLQRFRLERESWADPVATVSVASEPLVQLPDHVTRVLRWVRPLHRNDKLMVLLRNNEVCSLPSAQRQALDSVVAPGSLINSVVHWDDNSGRLLWFIHCTDGLVYPVEIDDRGQARKLPIESTYRLVPGGELESLRPPLPRVHWLDHRESAVSSSLEAMSQPFLVGNVHRPYPEGEETTRSRGEDPRSAGATDAALQPGDIFGGTRSMPNRNTDTNVGRDRLLSLRASADPRPTELQMPLEEIEATKVRSAPGVNRELPTGLKPGTERTVIIDRDQGACNLPNSFVYRSGGGLCITQYDIQTGKVTEHMLLDGAVTALCLFDDPVFLAMLRLPNDLLSMERIGCFPRGVLDELILQQVPRSWPFSPPCTLELMLDVITQVSRDRQTNLQGQQEHLDRTLMALRPAAQYAYLLASADYQRERIAALFSVNLGLEPDHAGAPALRLAIRLSTGAEPTQATMNHPPPLTDGCSFVALLCPAPVQTIGRAAGHVHEHWSVIRSVPVGFLTSPADECVMYIPLHRSSHAPLRLCSLLCFHGQLETSTVEEARSITSDLQLFLRSEDAWWLMIDDRQLDLFDLVQRISDTSDLTTAPLSMHFQVGTRSNNLSKAAALAVRRGQRQVTDVPPAVLRDLFGTRWSAAARLERWDISIETISGARFQMRVQSQPALPDRYLVTLNGTLDIISWARVAIIERCRRTDSHDNIATRMKRPSSGADQTLPVSVRRQLEEWLAVSMLSSSSASPGQAPDPETIRASNDLGWIRASVSSFRERLEFIYRIYGLVLP